MTVAAGPQSRRGLCVAWVVDLNETDDFVSKVVGLIQIDNSDALIMTQSPRINVYPVLRQTVLTPKLSNCLPVLTPVSGNC